MNDDNQAAGRLHRIIAFRESGILLGLVALCLLLCLFTDTFLSRYNLATVARQASFVGIVAFGQTLALLTGGIDLSVGSLAGLSAILCTLLMTKAALPAEAAIVLGVGIGTGLGLLNGLLVAKMRINPFIVTLATGEIFAGAILVITEGYPVLGLPSSFRSIGQGAVASVPIPILFMLLAAVALSYLLRNTPFGRGIYAIGGNRNASRLVGIRVDRSVIAVYALSGLLASFAGILYASRINAGQATIGASWVMPCITAAIIGGTSLSGGEGSIVGTLLGSLFMGVLANGIVLVGVTSYWERIIIGMVVILAMIIDVLRNPLHPLRGLLAGFRHRPPGRHAPGERDRIS
ncbi:MAG: ABC transporter permease [Planctomycetaceae bacterium]|nr:ABC transporter permease [Planctomycetaceae bacterium]